MIKVNNINDNLKILEKKLGELCEQYEKDFGGEITLNLHKLDKPNEESKFERYERYIKDSNLLKTDNTMWNASFKFSPISVEFNNFIPEIHDRHEPVDAINVLEDVINGSYTDVIAEAYNIDESTDMYVEDILKNPKDYPSELVKDLDELLEEMYNHNPYFRYDW